MLQLSAQLTQAIALVELQRATVEESILRLFGEAQQLNQVSDALCEAATTQGTVLIHLQQLLQSGNAPSGMAESLAPAALGIAAASGALAAAWAGPACAGYPFAASGSRCSAQDAGSGRRWRVPDVARRGPGWRAGGRQRRRSGRPGDGVGGEQGVDGSSHAERGEPASCQPHGRTCKSFACYTTTTALYSA